LDEVNEISAFNSQVKLDKGNLICLCGQMNEYVSKAVSYIAREFCKQSSKKVYFLSFDQCTEKLYDCTLNECEKYLDSLDDLGLAVIDGFHYSKDSKIEECFEQKFGNLMRNLKIYTKSRNIPIIFTSGFFKNKNLANPQNFMTCLRGDMICDCDTVMNVFKHSNTKAKIIIGKNRDRGFDAVTILLE
jgi:hypothetical protein